MNKSTIAAIAILAMAAAVLGSSSCSSEGYSGKTESITIGSNSSIGTPLYIRIAQEQHFFTGNGLDVTCGITRKG